MHCCIPFGEGLVSCCFSLTVDQVLYALNNVGLENLLRCNDRSCAKFLYSKAQWSSVNLILSRVKKIRNALFYLLASVIVYKVHLLID